MIYLMSLNGKTTIYYAAEMSEVLKFATEILSIQILKYGLNAADKFLA